VSLEAILERIAVALEKRNAMDVRTVVTETSKLVDKIEEKDAKAAKKAADKAAKKAAEAPESPKAKEPAATTATDAAAGSTTTPDSVPASAKPEAPADSPKKAKKLTVDDLRAVMQKLRDAKYPNDKQGTVLCQDLLEKQFGSRTLGGLKEADYEAVVEAFKV